jgi:hypothetical protein
MLFYSASILLVLCEKVLLPTADLTRRDFSTSWDVKWWGEAHVGDGYYSAELAIPMNSLKFQDGSTYWSINSYRFDTQTNERTIWSRVPQNQLIANLAFTGILEFEKPLGNSSTSIALIPFVAAGGVKILKMAQT